MSKNFDGVNDWVEHGDLVYTQLLTVACWFQSDTLTSIKGLVVKRNTATSSSGTAEWQFMTDAGNTVSWLAFSGGGGAMAQTVTTSTFGLNQWNHVAATHAGSGKFQKVYFNGVMQASSVIVNTIGNTTSSVQVGARTNNNNTRWLDGRVADVHFYNRVLDDAEIRQIMRIPGSVRQNLVVFSPYWDGVTALDYSGNANHGTLNGSVFSATSPPVNGAFVVGFPMGVAG